VDTSGVVLDPAAHVISTLPGRHRNPSVISAGRTYLVAWEHGEYYICDYDIHGNPVDSLGHALWDEEVTISVAPGCQRSSSIAFDGTNCFVVWGDHRGLDADVYGARVHDHYVIDPGGIVVSCNPGPKWYPSAAFDGTNYLVVWQDHRNGLDYDIYAARVDRFGMILDPSSIPICTEPGDQMFPSVAFDGANYLVVWFDERMPDLHKTFGTRVSQSGEVLDPSGICISPSGYCEEYSPRVVFGQSKYLVVWNCCWGHSGACVSVDGAVLDTGRVSLPKMDWFDPTGLSFYGTNYLVVWEYGSGSPGREKDIYGARFDTSAILLDSIPIPICTLAAVQRNPSVAFDGRNHLVVWEDARNGSEYDIYGARVETSGIVLETLGIPICTASGNQSQPSAAFDGLNYFVVWEDWRDDLLRIFGTRMDTSGLVLDPGGIELINEPYMPASPQVVRGSGNQLFIVYDAIAGQPYNGYRVFGALYSEVGIEEWPAFKSDVGSFSLGQSFPNPVASATAISYRVPKSKVSMKVYDSSGRMVRVLVDGEKPAGSYSAVWDGRDALGREMPSGIYFCRLQAGESSDAEKMILVR
jgi:hypothetical protein